MFVVVVVLYNFSEADVLSYVFKGGYVYVSCDKNKKNKKWKWKYHKKSLKLNSMKKKW